MRNKILIIFLDIAFLDHSRTILRLKTYIWC